MLIIKDILYHRRKYFIDKVKAPLQLAIEHLGNQKSTWVSRVLAIIEIIRIARRYPEPTKDNLVFRNSRIIVEIQDELNKYLNIPQRKLLLNAALRILADEIEHDGPYSWLFDWFIYELIRRGWQPEPRGTPMHRYWNGPLYKDNFTETNPNEFAKRVRVLIEQAKANHDEVQRNNGELWYNNLEKVETILRNIEANKKEETNNVSSSIRSTD